MCTEFESLNPTRLTSTLNSQISLQLGFNSNLSPLELHNYEPLIRLRTKSLQHSNQRMFRNTQPFQTHIHSSTNSSTSTQFRINSNSLRIASKSISTSLAIVHSSISTLKHVSCVNTPSISPSVHN